MTPNNGEMLSSGNGMEQQLPPQINADVERLRDDFRTFIADCQTLPSAACLCSASATGFRC